MGAKKFPSGPRASERLDRLTRALDEARESGEIEGYVLVMKDCDQHTSRSWWLPDVFGAADNLLGAMVRLQVKLSQRLNEYPDEYSWKGES